MTYSDPWSQGCTRDAASSSVTRDADDEAKCGQAECKRDAALTRTEVEQLSLRGSLSRDHYLDQVATRLQAGFSIREIEHWLTRRARLSRNQAAAITAQAKRRHQSGI